MPKLKAPKPYSIVRHLASGRTVEYCLFPRKAILCTIAQQRLNPDFNTWGYSKYEKEIRETPLCYTDADVNWAVFKNQNREKSCRS